MRPPQTTSLQDEAWTRLSSPYARIFPVTDFYLALLFRIHRMVPVEGRILDLGCGPGVLAESLLSPHREVHAIDASPAMIDELRARIPADSRAVIARGDARDLSCPDEHFDAVVASNLLCFFDDPGEILREVVRVLRPGGTFITSGPLPGFSIEALIEAAREDFSRKGILDGMADDLNEAEEVGRTVARDLASPMTAQEVGRACLDAGFQAVEEAVEGVYAGQCHLVRVTR